MEIGWERSNRKHFDEIVENYDKIRWEYPDKLYKDIFEVFMRHSDKIERVTFWGKADSQSWRGQGHPLLFDRDFNAKPAFYSIMSLIYPDIYQGADYQSLVAERRALIESQSEPEAESSTDAPSAQSSDRAAVNDNSGTNDDMRVIYGLIGVGAVAVICIIVYAVSKKKS